MTELRPGNEYCEFTTTPKAVALVKVVPVTASPASVQFSATAWNAPATS
ncbi:hypothetical protein KV557_23870 [Kitasatospora aureofaciens]|nr:hypothetical protein [Kitasatospora aureofaciens]MBV6700105.1 hypothetical protein [Kitasatospora aureofaciens]